MARRIVLADSLVPVVAAQLIGIATLRHVIRVEPLANASPDEIVTLVTSAIEHYLR